MEVEYIAAFNFSKSSSFYLREVGIKWKGLSKQECTWELPAALLGEVEEYEWSEGAKRAFKKNELCKGKAHSVQYHNSVNRTCAGNVF